MDPEACKRFMKETKGHIRVILIRMRSRGRRTILEDETYKLGAEAYFVEKICKLFTVAGTWMYV